MIVTHSTICEMGFFHAPRSLNVRLLERIKTSQFLSKIRDMSVAIPYDRKCCYIKIFLKRGFINECTSSESE